MSWLLTIWKGLLAYWQGKQAGVDAVHQQEVARDDDTARAVLRSQQDAPDTRADLSRELRDGDKF